MLLNHGYLMKYQTWKLLLFCGYSSVRLDRNRHGGGVLIYIDSTLTWEVILKESNEMLSLYKVAK